MSVGRQVGAVIALGVSLIIGFALPIADAAPAFAEDASGGAVALGDELSGDSGSEPETPPASPAEEPPATP